MSHNDVERKPFLQPLWIEDSPFPRYASFSRPHLQGFCFHIINIPIGWELTSSAVFGVVLKNIFEERCTPVEIFEFAEKGERGFSIIERS